MMKKIIKQEHLKNIKKIGSESKKKASSFAKDFKNFATKGNIIDMAVGVIIGSAFTKIVNSLVNEIISPLLGTITGKVNFSSLFISLNGVKYDSLDLAKSANAPIINYGVFISNIIDFLIVAVVLFIFIKMIINSVKKEEPITETTKICPYCISNIDIKATRCSHCTSILEEDNI